MIVFLRLSKAGYGTVNEIETWDARKVIQAIHYEGFCFDYESALIEVNKA